MKVLITGCAGFLGTNLALKLLADPNNQVFGIDNLVSGSPQHIELLSEYSNFKFHNFDCRNLTNLREKLPVMDLLFHFAANSDIAAALTNPTIDFELGIGTTHGVLEYCRSGGVKHLVFSSGSGVYGEAPNEIFTEDSFVGTPTSTYGATKLSSEALISAYSFMFDFKATVFRFSNLIGPRHTHGVIYDFLAKLKSNPQHLDVLGDGTQLKPYIHISDALAGVQIAIQAQTKLYEVFNVSNSTATSVAEIANMVISELNLKNVQINYQQSDRGWKADIPKYMMSSAKLQKLGWNLQYDSNEAVKQTIQENI